MKSMYARATAGVLCAAMLAGCGGDDNGNLTLLVTVNGLAKPGLVLKNGDQTVSVPVGSNQVYFPNLIAEDSTINIEIVTQPTAAVCTVDEASGRNVSANYYTALRPQVYCVTNSYKLGGTVTGLTQDQLVLAMGNVTATIRPETGNSFVFPTNVFDGANYGVTVLQQPEGLTCTVDNPTGTMPSGDKLNLAVSCVPRAS
ncbi:hypothetical protein [Pseudoduganella umbonata]|uniref:Uncharacterized protein n=1 Tax=Pseudoduganella umbonata TaxID=864828 RepID=A0A4P8HTS7_9BURK|nr:hypothetical protein [Pseudoduganella umbonata]MBB3220343.1 hypothetical protein [Pseudoduganella umbonata]QCP12118.1 hypothetical protein FCL38_18120 [Pseudoduganella umbonata]